MEDAISILTPLAAVAAVIAGAYWTTRWMARRNSVHSSGRHIKVLERVMLSKDTCLALVRVCGTTYLASVSTGRVELIREVDPKELTAEDTRRAGNDFVGILAKALGKGKQPPGSNGNGGGQDGAQP